MFVLPFVVSILTLRSVVNKDSAQNYTILSLIISGSYIVGLVLYLLLINADLSSDALQTTLLSLIMLCTAVLVTTGGAMTLAWDAESSTRVA
jgi:hypothetical protein